MDFRVIGLIGKERTMRRTIVAAAVVLGMVIGVTACSKPPEPPTKQKQNQNQPPPPPPGSEKPTPPKPAE
jgi:hypothetical protein